MVLRRHSHKSIDLEEYSHTHSRHHLVLTRIAKTSKTMLERMLEYLTQSHCPRKVLYLYCPSQEFFHMKINTLFDLSTRCFSLATNSLFTSRTTREL